MKEWGEEGISIRARLHYTSDAIFGSITLIPD